MTSTLEELIEAAKTATPTLEHREQQRRSFFYGNMHLENATRQMVDHEAEKLAEQEK
jgi:hypothetical protein